MYLHLVLAQIEPAALSLPSRCPAPHCEGTEFRLHQQVVKPLKDALHSTVTVRRYRCCRCGHTFRVYPPGVSRAPTSRWVQQLAILLYLLGLSYADVSSALEALGVYVCKSRVHDAVCAAKLKRDKRSQAAVFGAVRRQQRGVLQVECMGRWLPLSLHTGQHSVLVLDVDTLPPAELALLSERLVPFVAALEGQVLALGRDGAVPVS